MFWGLHMCVDNCLDLFEREQREEFEESFDVGVCSVDKILVDDVWVVFFCIEPECVSFRLPEFFPCCIEDEGRGHRIDTVTSFFTNEFDAGDHISSLV